MCLYHVPVLKWQLCGHTATFPTMMTRYFCSLARGPALQGIYTIPCPFQGYSPQIILVAGICSECAWTRYYRYMERLSHLAHIAAAPRRPPFLIPLYRLWRDPISGAEQWYPAGIAHSPTNSIHSEERAERVREWIGEHLRYRWAARPLPPVELDVEPAEGREIRPRIVKPNVVIGRSRMIGKAD